MKKSEAVLKWEQQLLTSFQESGKATLSEDDISELLTDISSIYPEIQVSYLLNSKIEEITLEISELLDFISKFDVISIK